MMTAISGVGGVYQVRPSKANPGGAFVERINPDKSLSLIDVSETIDGARRYAEVMAKGGTREEAIYAKKKMPSIS